MHLLQVYYTKDNESRKKMIQLEEFLARLRYRWIEKTVFTRTSNKFTIAMEEIPPIIAPALTGNAVNTEVEKKSVYLKSAQPTGWSNSQCYFHDVTKQNIQH